MPGRSDILLHPVRLRIVLAVANDEITTADLAERLPDVATATLYRHIATLLDKGFAMPVVIRGAPSDTPPAKTAAVMYAEAAPPAPPPGSGPINPAAFAAPGGAARRRAAWPSCRSVWSPATVKYSVTPSM